MNAQQNNRRRGFNSLDEFNQGLWDVGIDVTLDAEGAKKLIDAVTRPKLEDAMRRSLAGEPNARRWLESNLSNLGLIGEAPAQNDTGAAQAPHNVTPIQRPNQQGYGAHGANHQRPQPSQGQHSGPSGDESTDGMFGRFDQIKVHGYNSAITISALFEKAEEDGETRINRDVVDGFMFDFAEVKKNAQKINGKRPFDWDNKIQFAASEVEAVCIAEVLLGKAPTLLSPVQSKDRNSGNYIYAEGLTHYPGGGGNVYKRLHVSMGENAVIHMSMNTNQGNGNRTIKLPAAKQDRIRMAAFLLSRVKHARLFKGMDVAEIVAISRAILP